MNVIYRHSSLVFNVAEDPVGDHYIEFRKEGEFGEANASTLRRPIALLYMGVGG